MRPILPATVAALLLVSCSNGHDTVTRTDAAPVEARDLNLATGAAAEPLVLSAVERQSMALPASNGRGKVRLVSRERTAVPRPTGEESVATATEPMPAPAPEIAVEAPTPPVETPVASGGFGHSLAPGQTVASIPASSMGSGNVPAIQTIASGGSGIMVRRPDDNCAPHGGAIAINRVYNPSQGGFRRF